MVAADTTSSGNLFQWSTFIWRIFRQLLDALIRRKLPVGPDALDADVPDAFYQYPTTIVYVVEN